jgi:hypothetical protein
VIPEGQFDVQVGVAVKLAVPRAITLAEVGDTATEVNGGGSEFIVIFTGAAAWVPLFSVAFRNRLALPA